MLWFGAVALCFVTIVSNAGQTACNWFQFCLLCSGIAACDACTRTVNMPPESRIKNHASPAGNGPSLMHRQDSHSIQSSRTYGRRWDLITGRPGERSRIVPKGSEATARKRTHWQGWAGQGGSGRRCVQGTETEGHADFGLCCHKRTQPIAGRGSCSHGISVAVPVDNGGQWLEGSAGSS